MGQGGLEKPHDVMDVMDEARCVMQLDQLDELKNPGQLHYPIQAIMTEQPASFFCSRCPSLLH